MKLSALAAAPSYLFGSFKSRAKEYTTESTAVRQNLCFLTVISSHLKIADSKCFAAPKTLLNEFNELTTTFNLKSISRSTFFTIQSRLQRISLINVISEFDNHKGHHNRDITLNIEQISYAFKDVINLAASRAVAFLNRKLDCARYKTKTTDNNNNNSNLAKNSNHKNWTIITNTISKDIKNKKDRTKTPTGAFYTSRFKRDADQAYQLEQAARNGSISAGGAKKLISLHTKHNVFIKPAFLKFLQYRIFNFVVKPQKQRDEVKQANQYNRKPTIKKAAKNRCEPQVAPRPTHMTDETLQQGINLRDRIKNKIKNFIA